MFDFYNVIFTNFSAKRGWIDFFIGRLFDSIVIDG